MIDVSVCDIVLMSCQTLLLTFVELVGSCPCRFGYHHIDARLFEARAASQQIQVHHEINTLHGP